MVQVQRNHPKRNGSLPFRNKRYHWTTKPNPARHSSDSYDRRRAKGLWGDAIKWAAYTKNRIPHENLTGMTPAQIFHSKKSTYLQQPSPFRTKGNDTYLQGPARRMMGSQGPRSSDKRVYWDTRGIPSNYSFLEAINLQRPKTNKGRTGRDKSNHDP